MLRTPEPKQQAKLLVQALGELGLNLGHQQSLSIIATLAGHRSWNATQAAAKTPTMPVGEAPQTPPGWHALIEAAEDVVNQADDEGCSDDLTVTSASAVKRVERLCEAYRTSGSFTAAAARHHSFSADDVLSLRPDLTKDEAQRVVEEADHRFDASVGMNWDVLETHADLSFPVRYVEGTLFAQTSRIVLATVVVDLHDGEICQGTFDEMSRATRHASRDKADATIRRALEEHAIVVLNWPDGTFVDVEEPGPVFGGGTIELHAFANELREAETQQGKTFIRS